MKREMLIVLMVSILGLPLTAMASESDCFPLCPEPARVDSPVELKLDTVDIVSAREAASEATGTTSCDTGFMKTAEDLNDKVKPIKDIVGYVRSPQGLAIKLVNDHIVKIPAWIGYAMDPLGSIKRQAFGKARSLAKDALSDGNACEVAPLEVTVGVAASVEAIEAVNAKHSI